MHRRKIFQALQYIFFITIGIGLLWYVYSGQNFEKVVNEVSHADYRWAIPFFVCDFLCHFSRAHRWKILIEPIGYNPRYSNTILAMMFGYFINYVVPRLGEISRCYALQRSDKVPFNNSLGTVMTERAADIMMLFLVLMANLFIQSNIIVTFFHENIIAPILNKAYDIWIASGGLLIAGISFVGLALTGILLYVLLKSFMKQYRFKRIIVKAKEIALGLWHGISSIAHLRKKWIFIGHTLFIWLMYFMMTYLWFFALDSTDHLGWHAGLAIFAIGTLGRSVPIQGGGMGAYHFLVGKSLLLFGVSEVAANSLAAIIFNGQAVFYIGFGGICTIIVLMQQRRKVKEDQSVGADKYPQPEA